MKAENSIETIDDLRQVIVAGMKAINATFDKSWRWSGDDKGLKGELYRELDTVAMNYDSGLLKRSK